MWPNRLRGYLDALGVLVCEVAGFVLLLRSAGFLGAVDFRHFGTWLQTTSPDGALTALARLLGIAVFGWLLISTLVYGAAVLSGKRSIIAKSRRLTLPVLRRVADSLAAASVAASTLGNVGTVAGATTVPRPAAIVQPLAARPIPTPITKPVPVPPSAARVSSTALGRHFPHPGPGHHVLQARGQVGAQVSEAASEANGFAGLPRGTKVVVVRPGDCLSVLAERHLGDWRLDTEIEALNWGRLQPDGRALVDDHWIYVGWVLVMPPNAVATVVVGEGIASPAELSESGHVNAASTLHQPAEKATVAATTAPAVRSPEVEQPVDRPSEVGRSGRSTVAAPDAEASEGVCSTRDGPARPNPRRLNDPGSAASSALHLAIPLKESANPGPDVPNHLFLREPETSHGSPSDQNGDSSSAPSRHNGPHAGPSGPGSPGPHGRRSSVGNRGDAAAGAAREGVRPPPVGPQARSAASSGKGALGHVVAHGAKSAATSGSTRDPQGSPDATTPPRLGVNPPGDAVPGGDDATGRNVIDLGAAAGIGAIAGAGIVWRLDRSRREQSHRRAKGTLIRRNRPEVEAAERCVRAIAREDAMRWVDNGMRYLSGLVEQLAVENQGPLPSLALVRVGSRGLEIVLSPPVNVSLGWFSPTGGGTALVLDADITLEELQALGADRWTAWPTLVSLGASGGDVLMLNLEHAGSLSVEGPDDKVLGVLGQVALELSSQPWSDEMLSGVYTLGDSALDQRLPGINRVPASEAGELAEKLGRVSASHQELAGPFALAGLRALACEALPSVVVGFAGTSARVLEQLAEAAVPDRSGLAVAGAGPYPGARWKLELSNGGGGVLHGEWPENPLSFELVFNCGPQDVALLSQALGAASDPPIAVGHVRIDVAQPQPTTPACDVGVDVRANGSHFAVSEESGTGSEAGPGRADSGTAALPRPGSVEICVLGPLDIEGGEIGALEPSRRMAVLALLAHMATHRRPLRADELASALWPLDASKDGLGGPQRKTIMNLISRARGVLGCAADGTDRLAYSPQGYRLSPEVTSDWERLERHLVVARQQQPPEVISTLRAALDLVHGEPFGGVMSSQFFEWVASEHLDLAIVARVVDAAQDLGQYALDGGDFETVVWAVEKGLQLEPTREELFRLWMHALGRTGRPARVDDVYRRLALVLHHRLSPLHEPQPDTREVWRRYTQAEAGRAGELEGRR
jgi:DNA-binding SARP family transcriptional activator